MGLQEWLARRMGVSPDAAARAAADSIARRQALEAVAARAADQTQAIPESIRSAVQTAGAPTQGPGPAIPRAAAWDRSSRVSVGPAGGIKAAVERARAARDARVPFRQLANEIRAAIEAATPVTVEAPPGILQSNQFAALQDPTVQALLSSPDAQNALITIADDLKIPVDGNTDLAGAVIRGVAENAQASARSAARADSTSRDPRMGSTSQIATSDPSNAALGIDASGQRAGVYAGPEMLDPMEASPGVVVSYLPAIHPVTGKPKQAYVIDPVTGQPVLDPDGNVVPRIAPGTTNAPELPQERAQQIVENGLNYAGVEVAQEPIGIFAARTYKTPDGRVVQEPDFNRPVHQLVKRRTGGDGNRSPEAVEFLLPLPDGTFQRLTPGGGGRPEVLGQEEVQRLIYQGYEPQGTGLDWLRPNIESPQAVGRRIIEATMSGGTTNRRTARAILDQYEALLRIGGQEAADDVLAEAGGAGGIVPDSPSKIAQRQRAVETGVERLQSLTQMAERASAAERQTAPLIDAIRINRNVAEPSTARRNSGLPELSRNTTAPQEAAFGLQADTSGGSVAQLQARLADARARLSALPERIPGAPNPRAQGEEAGKLQAEIAAIEAELVRISRSSPATVEITAPAPAAAGGTGVSVVEGLRLPRRPRRNTRAGRVAAASGVVSASPPAGQVFDATGREDEILAGGFGAPTSQAGGPARAVWRNKDYDQPVEVTGVAGEFNGETYYSIAGSTTAIPESQLDFFAEGDASVASSPSVPYDTEARYDIFSGMGVRRPAAGTDALAAFVVDPGSWAAGVRPPAASLAEMLQETRRIAGARGIEDLPRGFQQSFGASGQPLGTVSDVSALPLRVRAARSAAELRAALDALRAARGPGLSELQSKLSALRAIDERVQGQLAPLYARLRELRSRQGRGDGFTAAPPEAADEMRQIQEQIDAAEAAYRPALDETTRLIRERTEGPSAERFRQLTSQIIELERQYGLQASAEGDALDSRALQAAGAEAARAADPLSAPIALRPGRRKSVSAGLDDEDATRAVIDGARDTSDPARNWTPASTLRQLFRDFLAEKLRPKMEELAELQARGRAGDVEAREKAAELSAAIERYRSQTSPLGLQDPESRAKEMREPSQSEVDSFERATAREAELRNKLAVAPEEERNPILRELYKAQSETRTAMRRLSPDFDALQDGAAAAQDRHFQTLLGGGNDRASGQRMDRAASDSSGMDTAYDGIGGFDVESAVSGGLDGSGATRAARAPQRAAMSADAALQELLRSDAGDARAVIEGIVAASNRAGVPMTPEQVIYSMLKNYRGSSAVAASGKGAERMGRSAADVGDAGFSDDALQDVARRGWQDVQRMSPASAQPSATVGEYTAVQQVLRGPARLREIVSRFLRPGDIARSGPQPDAPTPQDRAWAMLPDPEAISPDSAPGVAMPPELARQAQSQLAAAEQQIAALEQQGLDTAALRDRAQSVRNAISLRLQGELKPAMPRFEFSPRALTDEQVRMRDRARAAQAAAAKADDGTPFSQTAGGRRFLEDTLRMGGYSPASGRAYAVDTETANRLRALEVENRGNIVDRNRDESARELAGDKDTQIDTSNPVIFGVNRKGSELHEIVAARESGSEPVMEILLARPHDPNAPAPQGMEVVLFNEEGVPTFVRNDGNGVRIVDARGRDVDFDAPRADQIDLRPEAAGARERQRAAQEPRGAADLGGPAVIAAPVPEAARRARELQEAARLEAEEIRAEARAAAQAEAPAVGEPAARAADPEPTPRPTEEVQAPRSQEPQAAPAGRRSRLGTAAKVGAGLVAGGLAVDKAQEAGYLPSNRDIVMGLVGPAMLAMPAYAGDESPPEDTKQVAEPIVERIRRARQAPYLTSSNFLPY